MWGVIFSDNKASLLAMVAVVALLVFGHPTGTAETLLSVLIGALANFLTGAAARPQSQPEKQP